MANAKRKVDISRIDRNFSAPGIGDFNIVYTDVKKTPFVIEGLPWFKQNKSAYYRIPKKLTEKDTNEELSLFPIIPPEPVSASAPILL